MSADSVQNFLSSFDQLSPAEKLNVVREIGKRVKRDLEATEGSALVDDELTFLTDEMFQIYDREEGHHGSAESASW